MTTLENPETQRELNPMSGNRHSAPAWWKPGVGGKCRCQTYWSGLRSIHCITCHETFTSPAGLDRHRRNYECLDPAERGLVLTKAIRVEFDGDALSAWAFPGAEPAEDVAA